MERIMAASGAPGATASHHRHCRHSVVAGRPRGAAGPGEDGAADGAGASQFSNFHLGGLRSGNFEAPDDGDGLVVLGFAGMLPKTGQ